MTLRFDIRPSTASDFNALYALWKSLARDLGPPMPGVLRQRCTEGLLFVAIADGGRIPLGFANYHVRLDGTVTLYEIAVSKFCTGKGVARALMERVFNKSPIGHMRLKCITSNPANMFYKKLGFKVSAVEQSTKKQLYVWEKKCTPQPPQKQSK